MLSRENARWAEPIEGPLTKRQSSEASVGGGGGYDWLLIQAEKGKPFYLEALRRALVEDDKVLARYGHGRKVHVVRGSR
jgi:hypothetical protein